MEAFTELLKREKDVCVTFEPCCEHGSSSMYRYQLAEHGVVFEVYNYNRTIYYMCHIDDERSMSDTFLLSLRCAIKMEATSDEDKEKFKGILDEP